MSGLEKHVYFRDTIVIGGTLPAFLYAFFNELPLICVGSKPPFEFDEVSSDIDFDSIGLRYKTFKTYPNYERYYGKEKRLLRLWERTGFLLGTAGLMPVSTFAENMRVVDNQLRIATERQRTAKINFNKLVVFDDKEISGLPSVRKRKEGKNRVIDWFSVSSGCNHGFDLLEDPDDFINKVVFYPTKRSGNNKLKDLYTESFLTDEQLQDFDYSDTMARFKVLKMMKAAGIRGERNGRNPLYPERSTVPYKYYAVKIDAAERVIYPTTERLYEPDPRFEFRYDTTEELLKEASAPTGYLGKISEVF